MSALGHKRTFRIAITMSALRPKADIQHGGPYVPFVPKLASVDFSSCRQTMSGRADFNRCNKLGRRRLMLFDIESDDFHRTRSPQTTY